MAITDSSTRRITLFAKVIIRVGFFAWVSFACLWLYYGFSRPTSEQPEVGRLHRLDTHGHVAYLTHREMTNLHVLRGTAIGLFLIAGAMALVIKMRQRRNAQNQSSE